MITAITFDDISPAYLSSSKLKWLIDLVEELNIPSTFFTVPNDMFYASEEFKSHLRNAVNSRHELSLHGYMHKKNEFGILYPVPLSVPIPRLERQEEQIKKGRESLVSLMGVEPKGFRAPYYMHNSNTIKALANLNFRYDSSATVFKTTHCSSFRIRWLRDLRPFIYKGVVEMPVTGDYTYNLSNYGVLSSLRVALRDFELVKASNGVFVVNNHPSLFSEREAQFLETLIKRIRGETVFQTMVDASQVLLKGED